MGVPAMAVMIEHLEELEARQNDFFQGSIADRFLAGATATLPMVGIVNDRVYAASPDCGTPFLGCPLTPSDDPNSPICVSADPGGRDSCGLCTTRQFCPESETCPIPPDNPPPEPSPQPEPDTTSCSDSSDGTCYTPSTDVGCYSTYQGC